MNAPVPVGVVGSGFLAAHLVRFLATPGDLAVARVLTRRDPGDCAGFPAADRLTRSIQTLIAESELIVECSGHPIWAAEVIDAALSASRPVVTMDSELHVTCGSALLERGAVLTEAGPTSRMESPTALAPAVRAVWRHSVVR